MKIFYFDTETTGLDPVKNDIVQIAGIIEIDGKEVETFKFNCQPFDYNAVDMSALKINRLTIEKLKTFPQPHVVYKQFIQILERHADRFDKNDKLTPAGQNVGGFDVPFLKQFFVKNNDSYYGSWFNYQHVDLIAFSRVLQYAGLLDVPNVKLLTLAKKFGVELEAHNAMEDIRATKKVLGIMINRYLICVETWKKLASEIDDIKKA